MFDVKRGDMEPNKKKYIEYVYTLLPDVMGIFFAFSIMALGAYLGYLMTQPPDMKLADYIQLVILIFIAVTAVISFLGYKQNTKFIQSKEYLQNAIELVNRAREVLTEKDLPQSVTLRTGDISVNSTPRIRSPVTNDRICWVTAARLITRAEIVASKLTVEAHKRIFEAEHDYQRHTFRKFLTSNGQPLPAAFFFGMKFVDKSIGDAAYDSLHAAGESAWIPERVVSVIYRFFQYPEEFDDPLEKSVELSEREKMMLSLAQQSGAHDYLEFRGKFVATRTQIFRREGNSLPPKAVEPTEISAEMAEGDTSGFSV